MSIYTPYTYMIAWSKINVKYYGVRFARKSKCLYKTGCHPDDLWKTYFTSCVKVQEYRDLYGEPDVIQVRKTFENAIDAQQWEKQFLRKIDALNNEQWLNNSICGGFVMNKETTRKISIANQKPKSTTHRESISKARTGMKFSDSHRENIRKATTGVKQTKETKLKKSKITSNQLWYNDGARNTRSAIPLGQPWMLGRLKGFKWSKNL